MMEDFQFPPPGHIITNCWGSHEEPGPGDDNLRWSPAWRRFLAWCIDWFLPFLVMLNADDTVATLVVAFTVWNAVWLQGRTGASLGKKALGLQLIFVPEDMHKATAWTPVVPGVPRCAARYVAHFFDSICLVGVFKGLWNPYGKTWADTLARTVVIWDDRQLVTRETYKQRRR